MADDNPKHPPPWLFGITGIPYGVGGSFAAVTMPFFARKANFTMGEIGWYGTALLFPPIVQFLYAPIVDVGPKRKHWLWIVTLVGAICFGLAVMMPLPSRMTSFLALAFIGQTVSGLAGSCNGGLLATTMPDGLRGAAGGWLNVGNLAGGAVSTVFTLMLAERFAPIVVGLGLIVFMTLPCIAVVWLREPDRPRRQVREVFRTLWHDVTHVVRVREGWTGMLLFSSPVGTAALINYFAGMAPDYHATARTVEYVNGWGSAIVTAVGSLVGGYLCDRYSRRAMYMLSGGLTAMCALLMMASPISPATYAYGVTAYLFVTGLCYSAFSAAVLETIGKGGAAASTQYALFVSCGNLAINYVGLVDTRFDKGYGPRGLLGVDAAMNVIGIIALYFLFRWLGGFKKRAEAAA